MSNESRYIQLSKQDLFIILGFCLVLATFCFMMGVRLGKKQYQESAEYQQKVKNKQEQQRVKLVSDINEPEEMKTEDEAEPEQIKVDSESVVKGISEAETEPEITVDSELIDSDSVPNTKVTMIMNSDHALKGRYSIVLGEFLDLDEAVVFAESFQAEGFDAYVKKVRKSGLDKAQVSIGAYTKKTAVVDFINKQQNLFLPNKYKITQL